MTKESPLLMVLNYDDDSETIVDARRQLNVFLLWVDIGIHSAIRMETWYLENLSIMAIHRVGCRVWKGREIGAVTGSCVD